MFGSALTSSVGQRSLPWQHWQSRPGSSLSQLPSLAEKRLVVTHWCVLMHDIMILCNFVHVCLSHAIFHLLSLSLETSSHTHGHSPTPPILRLTTPTGSLVTPSLGHPSLHTHSHLPPSSITATSSIATPPHTFLLYEPILLAPNQPHREQDRLLVWTERACATITPLQ